MLIPPAFLLFVAAACTPANSDLAPPRVAAQDAPDKDPAGKDPAPIPAVPQCNAEQFVACPSGPDCATRWGALIQAATCFDRAADACDALSCEHGCNIHRGTPKQIHCAVNASSGSEGMTRCGGIANWGCPEHMKCVLPPDMLDGKGTCVPDA